MNAATLTQAAPADPSLLAGVNVLVQGPTGTGKTHSLGTLADTGVELFLLFTESGLETTLGYWTDRGLEVPPNVHWNVLGRGQDSFATMARSAEDINRLDLTSLSKLQDPNRAKHNQFVELLKILSNFTDHRTGQSFGSVDSWGPDRCLALDSLSGLNPLALSLVVGGKPVKSQSDWGIAMDQIEKLVRQLTDGCKCHFIMTSHVEREIDQVLGGVKLTVSTLGVKLAPKIPPMFSDVILTSREGTKFFWSTANSQADLKARNLPIADHIEPSFKQILAKWQSRGGKLTSKVKT
jgi:AAA domain